MPDHGCVVAYSVVSVGPYALRTTIPGQWSRTRRTAVGETTSPPVITSRTPAKQRGSSSAITWNRPAETSRAVISSSAISRARAATLSSPSGVMTVRPPCSSGTHSP